MYDVFLFHTVLQQPCLNERQSYTLSSGRHGPYYRKNKAVKGERQITFWSCLSRAMNYTFVVCSFKKSFSKSRKWQFVLSKEKYHLVWCETAQWTASYPSTHVTSTNIATNSAQKTLLHRQTSYVYTHGTGLDSHWLLYTFFPNNEVPWGPPEEVWLLHSIMPLLIILRITHWNRYTHYIQKHILTIELIFRFEYGTVNYCKSPTALDENGSI